MFTPEFLVIVAIVCVGFVVWKSKSDEKKRRYPEPDPAPVDDIRKPDLTVSPDSVTSHANKDAANIEVVSADVQVPVHESAQVEVQAVEQVEVQATEQAEVQATAKPKQSRNNKRRRPKP